VRLVVVVLMLVLSVLCMLSFSPLQAGFLSKLLYAEQVTVCLRYCIICVLPLGLCVVVSMVNQTLMHIILIACSHVFTAQYNTIHNIHLNRPVKSSTADARESPHG
jgi:hypothetical protein